MTMMMNKHRGVFPLRFPKVGKPLGAKAPTFSHLPPSRGEWETGNRCDSLSHHLSHNDTKVGI